MRSLPPERRGGPAGCDPMQSHFNCRGKPGTDARAHCTAHSDRCFNTLRGDAADSSSLAFDSMPPRSTTLASASLSLITANACGAVDLWRGPVQLLVQLRSHA